MASVRRGGRPVVCLGNGWLWARPTFAASLRRTDLPAGGIAWSRRYVVAWRVDLDVRWFLRRVAGRGVDATLRIISDAAVAVLAVRAAGLFAAGGVPGEGVFAGDRGARSGRMGATGAAGA